MDDAETLARTFVSVWNERNSDRRRAMVRSLWATEGRHLMGEQDVRGYDALEARVAESNLLNVVEKGYVFHPPTAIQSLPGAVKFRWEMVAGDVGDVISKGVGFLALDNRGRIVTDFLFAES